MTVLHPWQQVQWQHLQRLRKADRLPHALILSGMQGLGKSDFARYFVKSLYCAQSSDKRFPCGQCPPCHQFDTGVWPDALQIMPEAPGKQIVIEDIRSLGEYFGLSSVNNQYKSLIIHEADSMNVAAMNALLKTLEEPVGKALLLLVTSSPYRLTATIKSRCQSVAFTPPTLEDGCLWLAEEYPESSLKERRYALSQVNHSPIRARQWLMEGEGETQKTLLKNIERLLLGEKTPIELAGEYEKQGIEEVLSSFLLEMLKYKAVLPQGNVDDAILCDWRTQEESALIQRLSNKVKVQRLWSCLEKSLSKRKNIAVSLNSRLYLEDIFIELTQLN